MLWLESARATDEVKKKFYPNGRIKHEIVLNNGLKHGIAKYYYETGTLKKEITYKKGKRDGIAKKYYENGILK